jgi:hypothetical protein
LSRRQLRAFHYATDTGKAAPIGTSRDGSSHVRPNSQHLLTRCNDVDTLDERLPEMHRQVTDLAELIQVSRSKRLEACLNIPKQVIFAMCVIRPVWEQDGRSRLVDIDKGT